MPARLRTAGPLIVRASTGPADLPVPTDLDPDHDPLTVVANWLSAAWVRHDVREAVRVASPDLADRIAALLDVPNPVPRTVRRAARSLATYLLRWQRRTTPFGLFAGITTAGTGVPTRAGIRGTRAVARPDAEWLARIATRLQEQPEVRPYLFVAANPLAVERDDRLLLEVRLKGVDPTEKPRDTSIRLTAPVRTALGAAREPIAWDDLVDHVATAAGADSARVTGLLGTLLSQNFLISSVTSTTAHEPLATLAELAARACAPGARRLARVRNLLAEHNAPSGRTDVAGLRTEAADVMRALAPDIARPLAVDVRLDTSITLPQAVIDEAERAATTLLSLSTEPFGAVRWLDYHARFRARYGAGTAVPVRELIADDGLGYPTGFLDAPRARPAWRGITERDGLVLNLLHTAALDGHDEVVLSDGDVTALSIGDPESVVPPARCEFGFAIHTPSPAALEAGDFFLRVTAAPAASTSLTGRFAHLLDPADRDHLTEYFAAPGTADDEPLVAQLVHRPRQADAENVVRVPTLAEGVIVLGGPYDGLATPIGVDDLAVTADDEQMYLIHATTGRRIIPVIPHALELAEHTPPLARFLAEVADARSAVYRAFDLGAARTLNHTPRIRYGRTVLAPARWILHTDNLGDTARPWGERFDDWRTANRVPSMVVLDHGGTRLPLDLETPLDRAVLRRVIERSNRVEFQEQMPCDTTWLGRPAEVLVPMTPEPPPARRPPQAVPVTASSASLETVTVRWAGNPARFDHLVVEHLPHLADLLAPAGLRRWWFARIRDLILPERDQFLALTLQFGDATAAGSALPLLTAFRDDLARRGLPAEFSVHQYHPHPGKYGTGPALEAAYDVFTADTFAAVEQARLARDTTIPAQAFAAASLAVTAAALRVDPESGYRDVLALVPHTSTRLDRAITETACALSNPDDNYKALRAAGGDAVADAWTERDAALKSYRRRLAQQRDPSEVLPHLWRDHHTRALGVDRDLENTTRLVARRAAQRRLALLEHR
ncbi:lantibiotic dehydratase [Myceligenerans halotolerans]